MGYLKALVASGGNTRRFAAVVIMTALRIAPQLHASDGAGTLLWSERLDLGVYDGAGSVAVEGRRIFVAGRGTNPSGGRFNYDWLVRAYDAKTGKLIWQDQHDGGANYADVATEVVADGGLAFVGGFDQRTRFNSDALVRAYDAKTGVLKWEDRFDYRGFADEVSGHPYTMAVKGGRLFVCGLVGADDFTNTDWYVRAYDATTGAVLWTDVFDGGDFDHAVSLAADGQRVFVSGVVTDAAIVRHVTVRAYDAGTGNLLWQDTNATGNPGYSLTDVGWQVAAQGTRVIVAGTLGDGAGGNHWLVRAYDATAGTVLWEDLRDDEVGAAEAWSVSLDGHRAIVAGFGGDCSLEVASNCDWMIRAYDQGTGTLLWTRQIDHAGGDDQPFIVVANGNRVVVAGYGLTGFGALTADWIVQVYDESTGGLVWQDQVNGGSDYAEALDAAVAGDQLFVVGDILGASGNDDWVVRAYNLRGGRE